jgi:hypothetical protein
MSDKLFSLKWIALAVLATFVFSACASNKTMAAGANGEPTSIKDANPFASIPIPGNFKFDSNKSFIYESGSGTVKVGRLFYYGWLSLEETIQFFENEMVNKGWKLINVIRQEGTILNYQKDAQMASLSITHSWAQSYVEIRIGPQ